MEEKTYWGCIIDKSQRNKRIFRDLNVTRRKRVWFGLITLIEVQIPADELDPLIKRLQENMADHVGLTKQEFYAHFYCGDEVVVVYKDKVFRVTSDPSTWTEAIEHGKKLGIADEQLDFLSPLNYEKKYF